MIKLGQVRTGETDDIKGTENWSVVRDRKGIVWYMRQRIGRGRGWGRAWVAWDVRGS